jgi:hypothetical protein
VIQSSDERDMGFTVWLCTNFRNKTEGLVEHDVGWLLTLLGWQACAVLSCFFRGGPDLVCGS